MYTCEICNTDKKLVRDHCHDSMMFRGVLCYFCNHKLGWYESDKDFPAKRKNKYKNWVNKYLENIKSYLEKGVTDIPYKSLECKSMKKKLRPSWKNAKLEQLP